VKIVSSRRKKIALTIAIAADALQFAFLPLFPAITILDDAIDVAVAIVMIALLGWHWAFLPSIVTKLIPVVDFLPTWTASVWLVTRGKKQTPPPPAVPPPPQLP
jgi:hypothetical protein